MQKPEQTLTLEARAAAAANEHFGRSDITERSVEDVQYFRGNSIWKIDRWIWEWLVRDGEAE